MKYYTAQNNGRLGNQLYYALWCYLNNAKYKSYNIFNKQLRQLNISSIVSEDEEFSDSIIYEQLPINYEVQEIGMYFQIDDLHRFIKETILKSKCFIEIYQKYNQNISENTYAISIRNGDYYKFKEFLLPNRDQYLIKYLDGINNISLLNIFSDDNELNKKLYSNIFLQKATNVNYIHTDDAVHDMLYLSLHKNMCIPNSTFAYWSAFISNCLYENYQNIYCPNKVHTYDNDNTLQKLSTNGIHMSGVLDPRWNIQKIGD